MGGVCAGGTARRRVEIHHESTSESSKKLKSVESMGKQKNDESFSYPDLGAFRGTPNLYDSGELYLSISRELKPSTPARTGGNKAPSSFLGKASIVGLEKAVEVLDTLGSSMTNLNSGGFMVGMASRGNKISILAFEVANTITKGANLMQSLSKENVEYLKKEILPSKGVQQLVSTNMKELLAIAAADKREEFDVFSREVIRFGDMCKDPQWHNLGRYFSRLDLDTLTHKQLRSEAELMMQELSTLAQHTSELYHELHALDRFEQDYRRKLEELDSLNLPRKGEGLMMLHSELKHQRKIARSLKKKSLWAKGLEEVVEKLVDIVTYIHQAIVEAFGDSGLTSAGKEPAKKQERLGVAGLALHYANLITQIDNIASRPTSLPPNMRDGLYNGLPPSVKTALRSRLQAVDTKEELTIPQIKAEMEKTLQWLVPVAADTTKAHQGFGWVGEWANTGNGVQLRRNSWQDGVEGTNCPIMPGKNWTYKFQMKDQIGSFFYFPSLFFHKAAGGYGPIRINNVESVPLPFPRPDFDYDILIGDWYFDDYKDLRISLEDGCKMPFPDAILINGLRSKQATFEFQPGATYRLRISNVGLKTTLNFKIQDHDMLLVETEGAYTVKEYHQNLDIHVGQSYSVLVTAKNHSHSSSYHMVASSRFIPRKISGLAIIRYSGFDAEVPVVPVFPDENSQDEYEYSMKQALSIRTDLSVGAARHNPQGSYVYGSINISRTLILQNGEAAMDGQNRYTVNGISFLHPRTPLKLADYFQLSDVFEPGVVPDALVDDLPRLGVSVIDAKYRDFVHVVFQNPLDSLQTWHSDGYSFFVVGMGRGKWEEGKMEAYNMIDAIYCSTIQVYPYSWTAILIKLDNLGMWNLRSQDAEKWYLGQELYIRVTGDVDDPSKISLRDEAPIPANVIKCGKVPDL